MKLEKSLTFSHRNKHIFDAECKHSKLLEPSCVMMEAAAAQTDHNTITEF